MPAGNSRALQKARDLPTDVVILDLEDSVAAEEKVKAREEACAMVRQKPYAPRQTVIRINALTTPWGEDDKRAALAAAPDAILLPKVEDGATITKATQEWNDTTALWAMIETPRALLNLEDIAKAAKNCNLTTWVMGLNDLAKEARCSLQANQEPLALARSLCLFTARAYGLTIMDGVYNNIADKEGFANNARASAAMGFDGQTLIHPSQIASCNEAFSPTAKELAQARAIVEAFARPENHHKGVLQVDGAMVERLHGENAQRILDISNAINTLQEKYAGKSEKAT